MREVHICDILLCHPTCIPRLNMCILTPYTFRHPIPAFYTCVGCTCVRGAHTQHPILPPYKCSDAPYVYTDTLYFAASNSTSTTMNSAILHVFGYISACMLKFPLAYDVVCSKSYVSKFYICVLTILQPFIRLLKNLHSISVC